MRQLPPLLPLPRLLVLLSLLTLPACDGCNESEPTYRTPKTIDARLAAHVERLPPRTTAIGAIGRVAPFRTASASLRDRLDDMLPISGLVEKPFTRSLGFDPFAAEGWRSLGLGPDANATVALVDGYPVLMGFVDSRRKFDSHLASQLKYHWKIEGIAARRELAGHPVKVARKKGGPQVMWTYRGEQVIAVLPGIDRLTPSSPATMTTLLENMLARKPGDSLATTDGYQSFRRAHPRRHSFLYVHGPAANLLLPATAARLLSVSGLGLVTDADADGLEARLWLGLPDELRAAIEAALDAETSIDWHRLATDKTLAGLRLSLDSPKTWQAILTALPDAQARSLKRQLARLGDRWDVDFQTEAIEAWTGNAGLFFYGVGPNFSLEGFTADPVGELPQIGAIAGVQFTSAEALTGLVQKIDAGMGDKTRLRDLRFGPDKTTDRVRVLEYLPNGPADQAAGKAARAPGPSDPFPVKLYTGDRFLAASTTAIAESSIFEYLTGTREGDTPLAEVDGMDRGKTFVAEPGLTGGYLNVLRADDALADRLPPNPVTGRLLGALQELLIRPSSAPGGLSLDATLDWRPADDEPPAEQPE